MGDAHLLAFTIREIHPDEYAALGEIMVGAYADHLSPADTGYIGELRDVRGRAEVVPVLVAVGWGGLGLGLLLLAGTAALILVGVRSGSPRAAEAHVAG